jgi:ubiquitin-protein ligase
VKNKKYKEKKRQMTTKRNIIITRETIHRLAKDVKQIMKEPLDENGIYYFHDDTDMLKGLAMIVGQPDTPYYGGYYFFLINFSNDYPYSPPRVTFLTNGDGVRFNPNLYINGKVCVSILNTWAGEQWSSCQTIKTILLTISTLLCKDPLLNEPGFTRKHRDFQNYTNIIEYKNIDVAVMKMITKQSSYFPKGFDCFDEKMKLEFEKNKQGIRDFLISKKEEFPQARMFRIQLYKMNPDTIYDYNKLFEEFCKLI